MGDTGRFARAGKVLVGAGVIAPMSPPRLAKTARTLKNWKLTPATGFIVSAIRFPDEPAIIDEQGELTFKEVDERTNALAHAFAESGVEPGESVAIMCRDHRYFVESTVALAKLGATGLFYNTAFKGPQLKAVTEREEPVAIIYDEEFEDVIKEAAPDTKLYLVTDLENLIKDHGDEGIDPPEKPGRMTLLTSGSTGTPKGASRSSPDVIEAINGMLSAIPLHTREKTFFAAPLFHAWGFLQFNLGLLLSSTYILRNKFDPEETLKRIEETEATALIAVPVMLQRILALDEETRNKYDLSSLRIVASSGGALSGDLAQKWMDAYGDNLYNLYGSTEVAWAAIASPEDLRDAPGTAGKAPPGTTLKILDDDKNELGPGETGAIYVGNKMLHEGYTGDDEEDDVHDGMMATGDLGCLDDEGRLFISGRSDDMIVSGGENVYPEEVEETLEGQENVDEVAVIGIEDDDYGEVLKAFVVKSGEVSEDDLKKYVKDQLAGYKSPKTVEFMDELPRKPQGKVDKQALKADDEGEDEGDDAN